MSQTPFEYVGGLRIGTVEYVSPDEIKVLLDIESPDSIALNTGTPRPFPRVNSYLLIPNEEGYFVGQVEWLTVERSAFPKRQGMRDFGLVDLPYPLRKLSLNPLGVLYKKRENDEDKYIFRRGSETFPAIGDGVFLPTDVQLRSIVESSQKPRVKIGTSPLAGNADVYIDPDRLFGRHLAVLGNTGSGKSCTVAGIIRWSLEAAQKEVSSTPNARFIILDPNGEYARAFSNENETIKAKIFRVNMEKSSADEKERKLQVPLWFWNLSEWCAFTQAGERAHRPIIQKALRLRRNYKKPDSEDVLTNDLLNYLRGMLSTLRQEVVDFSPFVPCKNRDYWQFMDFLKKTENSLNTFSNKDNSFQERLKPIIDNISDLIDNKSKNEKKYNNPFTYGDIAELITALEKVITSMGGKTTVELPVNEDVPRKFSVEDLLIDLEFLATNSGNSHWFESFLSRVKSLLSDTYIKTIIVDNDEITLLDWLINYIGEDKAANGCLTIIDLSLVPQEIIYIVTAVIARMVFEALQRYRKLHSNSLPTVLVMEEAHTFIKRYKQEADHNEAAVVCCQVFERIAREGRKFGLGLLLSSQRPSELSQTVLSQCNTFILHRLSNDRDQELVQKLVPDNLRGLLRELPSLPTQNAILLGWASELPVLLKVNDLSENQRPQSDDPDFWSVWTGKDERKIDWEKIADDWQGKGIDKDIESVKPFVASTEEEEAMDETW